MLKFTALTMQHFIKLYPKIMNQKKHWIEEFELHFVYFQVKEEIVLFPKKYAFPSCHC